MNSSPASPPSLAPETAFETLRAILDPEFGLSIVELGLIYDVQITVSSVVVVMTLTSPHCPAGDVIMGGVHAAMTSIAGPRTVEVQLTWSPPWTPARMTRDACEQLGWREMDDV